MERIFITFFEQLSLKSPPIILFDDAGYLARN